MKAGIFLLLLFFSQLHAGFFSDLFDTAQNTREEQLESVEEMQVDEQPIMIEEKVFSDEDMQESDESQGVVKSKTIFLSYQQLPKKVYIHQHFLLNIQAVLTNPQIKTIQTSFTGGKNFKVLNPDAGWKEIGENRYTIEYNIKFLKADASLPTLRVTVQDRKGHLFSEDLKAPLQKHIALKEDPLYSNVLAKTFHIKSHHEKKYDDHSNIVLMEIDATEANLEDFHLPFASREGIDSMKRDADKESIYYFAILPNYQKEMKFKYFNLETNKFNRITFPILISDNSVSTQTDLNPQKSKYFFYKVIALLSMALILLLLYMKYKKAYLLFFSLILAVYTIYTKLITNNETLKPGVLIHILPTSNSTIFYKTSQPLEVKILLKKGNYTKVLLPNTKIGWIKNDDL